MLPKHIESDPVEVGGATSRVAPRARMALPDPTLADEVSTYLANLHIVSDESESPSPEERAFAMPNSAQDLRVYQHAFHTPPTSQAVGGAFLGITQPFQKRGHPDGLRYGQASAAAPSAAAQSPLFDDEELMFLFDEDQLNAETVLFNRDEMGFEDEEDPAVSALVFSAGLARVGPVHELLLTVQESSGSYNLAKLLAEEPMTPLLKKAVSFIIDTELYNSTQLRADIAAYLKEHRIGASHYAAAEKLIKEKAPYKGRRSVSADTYSGDTAITILLGKIKALEGREDLQSQSDYKEYAAIALQLDAMGAKVYTEEIGGLDRLRKAPLLKI